MRHLSVLTEGAGNGILSTKDKTILTWNSTGQILLQFNDVETNEDLNVAWTYN